jgi:hypothetical protein
MTLAEIKTFTTSKLGITDSATLAMAELFAKARWRTIWNEADWRQARYQETVAVNAGTQDVTLNARFDTVKACRWAGQNEITSINDISALMMDPVGYDGAGTPVAFVPIGRTLPSGALQVRLIRKPDVAGNLLVIGKRKPVELTTGTPDSDNVAEVPIPGGSECLCDFTMADLYEWLRQFSKAEWYLKKAAIQLEKMKEIESSQASEIRRLIPYVQVMDGEDAGSYDSMRPLG